MQAVFATFWLATSISIAICGADIRCHDCEGDGQSGIECTGVVRNSSYCVAFLTGSLVNNVFTTKNVSKRASTGKYVANEGNGCFLTGGEDAATANFTVACQCDDADFCVDKFNLTSQSHDLGVVTCTDTFSSPTSTCKGNYCHLYHYEQPGGGIPSSGYVRQNCGYGVPRLGMTNFNATYHDDVVCYRSDTFTALDAGLITFDCFCFKDNCNVETLEFKKLETIRQCLGDEGEDPHCQGNFCWGYANYTRRFQNQWYGCINVTHALDAGLYDAITPENTGYETKLCNDKDQCNILPH